MISIRPFLMPGNFAVWPSLYVDTYQCDCCDGGFSINLQWLDFGIGIIYSKNDDCSP